MNIREFESRFPPRSTRMGVDMNRDDEQIWFFYDNGQDVGVWKYDRRSTCGHGEIIQGEDAELARAYYKGDLRER